MTSNSKKDVFKCEGNSPTSDSDNYDFIMEDFPPECSNNNNVTLRFELDITSPNDWGKWFGIKNLCVVDQTLPINDCIGQYNIQPPPRMLIIYYILCILQI